MTEKQLQGAVVELAKRLGYLVYHTFDSRRSNPGWPDLVLCKPPRLIFAELKVGVTEADTGSGDVAGRAREVRRGDGVACRRRGAPGGLSVDGQGLAGRRGRDSGAPALKRNAESNGSNGVTEGVTGAVTSLACDQARDQARTPVPEPEPEDKASEGNEVLLKGITEARPEGLPFDKELVMAQLRSWAGDRLKPEIADHYASKLPFASLAKVLESATTARANDRPAWLVGALKKEIAEREETAA
jgi:hypothetical protein